MAGDEEVHEGASRKELLVEACRRNNTSLLQDIIDQVGNEDEVAKLLNETTTVMGNHLFHEAASHGNYDIIDMLLDQPNFECDPTNRLERDTPLHTAIRWINAEPPVNHEFGNALVEMMLEAGCSPRVKNKGGLTPLQLVDPRNKGLREIIQKQEYAALNAGDFVGASDVVAPPKQAAPQAPQQQPPPQPESDDDAEFSGSDEEERAEFERRRKAKRG